MKFGVREICEVVFKATAETTIGSTTFAAGQPVLYIDTAKTSTMEGAATTVYATGGRGNTRLLAWEGEKTLTFTVEDAMLSPIGFSVLSGAGVLEAGAGTGEDLQVHTVLELEVQDVSGGGTAEYQVVIDPADLGITAAEDADIELYVSADTPIYGTVIDVAGAVVDILGAATSPTTNATLTYGGAGVELTWTDSPVFAAGDVVRLDFYVTRTGNVTQLEIDAENFGGYYYVEASTLFRDQTTGEDYPAEIILPKVKIQSNFTFNMAATGDPSTFTFTMDAFPGATPFNPARKVLCAIQMITGDEPVA